MKEAIAEEKTLSFFDAKKPAVIQCDASSYGLGGVLMQDERPIYYISRALSRAE